MSFFNTEKRDGMNTTNYQLAYVGPGRYDVENSAQFRRQTSYAPFGSLVSRKNNVSQEVYVGPGQYNISSGIMKPSITKYENKNIIIVKINDEGGHQFKSRSNRFKDMEMSEVGPGSYYKDDSLSRHKRAMSSSLKRPKIVQKMKFINTQYLEQKQPTLLSDPIAIDNNEKNSTPKAKGVVSWGLNKRQRFQMPAKQQFNEQDKRKALSEFNDSYKKKIKVKPSAVFASKTIKSHFESQIYKTNNSFKAELRKMVDYKDEEPGPGTYEPTKVTSNKVLQKFQFFGSTVQRFPEKDKESVGPGSYSIQRKQTGKQYKQNQSFTQERHSYLPKNQIPGPGTYTVLKDFIRSSQSQKQFQIPFGSQKPRFVDTRPSQDKAEQPSFAANNTLKQRQQKRQRQLRILKQITQDHPSAVFSSKTNRFNKTEQEKTQIQIGSYDITQNDINSRIQKHQKLIKQLEECQLHKPPFLSSDQRFKQVKIHEVEHKNCWCLVKSVEKQMIQHQSSVFLSNEKRTKVFQQNFKAPPVGYYQNNDKGIIKNSFNSRFKKKNENRIKKDIALKKRQQRGPKQMGTQTRWNAYNRLGIEV